MRNSVPDSVARDDEGLAAVECFVLEFGTEHRLGERDVEVVDEVVAFAAEGRVWPDPNVDVQVAMGTTARTSCATARETQRGAIVDARRDLHGVRALLNGRPDASHVGHGSRITCPSPPHEPHALAVTICPSTELRTRRT